MQRLGKRPVDDDQDFHPAKKVSGSFPVLCSLCMTRACVSRGPILEVLAIVLGSQVKDPEQAMMNLKKTSIFAVRSVIPDIQASSHCLFINVFV